MNFLTLLLSSLHFLGQGSRVNWHVATCSSTVPTVPTQVQPLSTLSHFTLSSEISLFPVEMNNVISRLVYFVPFCLLTCVISVELCPSLLAVRTRLVCAILLYALTTEQLSAFLMLPWISSYRQANETLQNIIRLREKVTVIATSRSISSHVLLWYTIVYTQYGHMLGVLCPIVVVELTYLHMQPHGHNMGTFFSHLQVSCLWTSLPVLP